MKNIRPCIFLNIEFVVTNSMLHVSTAVHGGNDTLSSGTDAAGFIKSDVSALPKLAVKTIQGCIVLTMRQRRCAVYFKRSSRFYYAAI